MSAISNPYHGCDRNKARDRLASRPVQSVKYKWLSRLKFYEFWAWRMRGFQLFEEFWISIHAHFYSGPVKHISRIV